MFYFIKTPWWLKKLYGNCIWQMPGFEKIIYLTFDDGPHPEATPFVLDTLKLYSAKATFFCIGKNVVEQPLVYKRIISEGHAVGNHSFNHLNGWKTNDDVYMHNIAEAKKYIDSGLFRPPYGRITKFQLELLSNVKYRLTAIMWTVLSGDFDEKTTNEKCLRNVLSKSGYGSIVVFHDSEKAFERLSFTLPKVLEYFTQKGYGFEKIILPQG
ncbi:MAG: polysaccharide deacetylase family protein [Ferruginibacter sp.]